MCFFTAHSSAERTSDGRYFSGTLGDLNLHIDFGDHTDRWIHDTLARSSGFHPWAGRAAGKNPAHRSRARPDGSQERVEWDGADDSGVGRF